MNYCILVFLSSFLFQLCADTADYVAIDEHTFLVYRRYYFIARLDNTIQLLAKLYTESHMHQAMLAGRPVDFEEILPHYECEKLKHKAVKYSIACIRQTDCIKPLFMVWDSFKSYKLLKDDLFIEDFSKEIFLIARNTINHLQHCQQVYHLKHSCMDYPISSYTFDKLLHGIDVMTKHLCGCLTYEVEERSNIVDLNDLRFFINTDDVAFRFYCLKRIKKAMQFLMTLPEKDLVISHIPDQDLQVKTYRDKNIMQLWDDLKQYKHIDDDQYMRYFIYSVYVLLHEQAKRYDSLDDEALVIHDQMEHLPIEELLNAIDSIMSNITQIHQHYQHSGLPFIQWLKVYWWIPAALCSSMAFKLIKYYYLHTDSVYLF